MVMSRKKRILFCGEATFLNTGYATYIREILNYLNSTNKYDIAEMASYASPDDPRCAQVPWKLYPAALPKNATEQQKRHYNSKHTNQFGEYVFHDVCLDFMPDIVCDIRDFWMIEFVERSTYRNFFKWCIMPTVDAEPQANNWIETFKSADACLSYSDWSGEILQAQGCGAINYIGSAPPSAHQAYSAEKDKLKCRSLLGIPKNKKIIGTVMRNQRRKLYPDLFKMFRMILDSVENPQDYLLYCHTSYPDMGWDIPSLLQENGIGSNVMFTYKCLETGKPYASFFVGPRGVSPFTNKDSGVLCNVQNGASYDDLSNIMNAFDIYVQYANSEGFGLPQVEAAAGGVPVASIDYSAMHSVINQLGGIALRPKTLYKEMETGCMRAVPDNEYACAEILKFLSLPEEIRNKIGFETKQNFLKHFQWDKSGQQWEKYFDSVEIKPITETWLSPPNIKPIPEKKEIDNIMEQVKFLIKEVLSDETKIGSMLEHRMIKDLSYGFATTAMEGIYMNDSSLVSDGNIQKHPFNYDVAYSIMKNQRIEHNNNEHKRREAFNL